MDLWTLVAIMLGQTLVTAAAMLAWQRRRARLAQTAEPAPPRDPLTGLATRAGFDERLDAAVLDADRGGSPVTLLYVGLDGFGQINEAGSHADGDDALRQIADRLSASAGDRPLARLAGDEFVVLDRGAPEAVHDLARRLVEVTRRDVVLGEQVFTLGASIGLAAYPTQGSRPRLVGHAAAAMRSVKLAGGGAFAWFEPAMAVDRRERFLLRNELRQALERRQFELVFQPKVDAQSLQITAAEALLRWNHPRRGIVLPSLFIPVAERHGLIAEIGRWVIDEACRHAAEWRRQGLRMRVAVNISGAQLRQEDLVVQIESALARHHLQPGRFTCEITESVAMEDTAATQRAFEGLRRAGVHVSIDDFGTGFSSLASLRKLPAAELKIDRAFVCDIGSSADARSIAQAIVQMAHTLGLRVVAEGVETERQRDILRELGCDELQGFLFARPMSAAALALWAHDDRPAAQHAFRDSLFSETVAAPLDLRS